jgi:hypothetical protein
MRVSCRYPRRHAGVVYRMSRVDYGLYYSKLAPPARKSFPTQHGGTEKPCASSGTGRWGLRAPTRRREPNRDTEHPRAMGAMGIAHSTAQHIRAQAQHRSAGSWTTITNVRPTSRLISTPPLPGFRITPSPVPSTTILVRLLATPHRSVTLTRTRSIIIMVIRTFPIQHRLHSTPCNTTPRASYFQTRPRGTAAVLSAGGADPDWCSCGLAHAGMY